MFLPPHPDHSRPLCSSRLSQAARRGAAEPAPAPALTAAAPASPSDLSPELHAALAREAGLRAQITALHASTSWRLTAPLRALARLRRR